jgi:hypothetical protein
MTAPFFQLVSATSRLQINQGVMQIITKQNEQHWKSHGLEFNCTFIAYQLYYFEQNNHFKCLLQIST